MTATGSQAHRGGADAPRVGEAPEGLVTIVGAGNWMLAIDRIGPMVIEEIQGRYGPEVELCQLGSGGLDLIDHLHGQELMLVVDACISDRAPGEVAVVEPDLDVTTTRETSVHQIGPVEALVIARHLFPDKLPRRIALVLVETEGMDEEGEQGAKQRVIDLLDAQVARWREERAPRGGGSETGKKRD